MPSEKEIEPLVSITDTLTPEAEVGGQEDTMVATVEYVIPISKECEFD